MTTTKEAVMGLKTTEWGRVTYTHTGVVVTATPEQLYAWAHRSGAIWPCSVLADTGPGDLV